MTASTFRFICYSDTTACKTNEKMQSGILKSIDTLGGRFLHGKACCTFY